MKKLALVLAVLAALLLASAVYANGPIAMVDIDTVGGAVVYTSSGAGGNCSSFNPEQPGNWGGEFGGGAVTAFPGDDDSGHCILRTGGSLYTTLEMRVLDGIADDSFVVYVKAPGGKWEQVYTYTDSSTAEVWVLHTRPISPQGQGAKAGDMVMIKIVPTNVGWSGFNTWGQLAVDYVALY